MLFFVVTALMASMVAVSALTGSAQNSGGQYKGEGGQYKVEPPQDPVPGDTLYCAPEWLREWHQAQGWWYFWMYKWCHDGGDEWVKVYDGWEWWGPVEE